MRAGMIGLSKPLDQRFGTNTTGATMTDGPGHTRGLIAPLAENGVTFIDIGVNSASTPPNVPDLFLWQDGDGTSLIVMYHRKEYGGLLQVPGTDVAVAVEVRNDNSGPHTPAEIRKIYSDLRQRFPGAQISPASLTDVAKAVEPVRSRLPQLTAEIGDTWIYGVPSDPVKVSRYLELQRLRRSWIEAGHMKVGDATDLRLLRRMGLAAEHTWGADTKTWLDFDHYKPDDLAAVIGTPKYQVMVQSWKEKRDNLDRGVATLPPALRQEAAARLTALQVVRPSTSGLDEAKPGDTLTGKFFALSLDARTGAIRKLRDERTGRDWASESHPIALFAYQSLSKLDYDRFLAAYVTSKEDWAPKDFGKPNIEHFGAVSRTWLPRLTSVSMGRTEGAQRGVAELQIEDTSTERNGLAGWPRLIYLEVVLPDSEPVVHLNLSWVGKRANRLPEALWLTFQPIASEKRRWWLEKSDRVISPFDVVPGGSRVMHALSKGGLHYRDSSGTLSIESLDAPVVALGERSPLLGSKDQLLTQEPDFAMGTHFSLFNNAWGTNYRQWFGEDARFRFVLRF